MDPFIPVANPKPSYIEHKDEIQDAIQRVLDSGWYILGNEVKRFEEEFAQWSESQNCISVANGTDALVIAILACGVQKGDEIITTSHTAVATVSAIEQVGATPILADISPVSYCLDPKSVEALITSKTKAIIPVHIYGHPADMHAYVSLAKKYNLKLIEDCAQAHGAKIDGQRVGTFGDAATFSFYPTKNLGAIGDGGAISTNSEEIANRAKEIRQYGWVERYISVSTGQNSRLDEMQAAILRVKLPHLDEAISRRQNIASAFTAALSSQPSIQPPRIEDNTNHAFHLYVVKSDKREELQAHLKENNIGSGYHYPQAVHQQPAYQNRITVSPSMQNTEELYTKMLSLPMFPELSTEEIDRICNALQSFEK